MRTRYIGYANDLRALELMQVRLSSPLDLPDIDGECIKIEYSLEEVQGSNHPVDIVLIHNGAELWREISFFEDIERFVEIAQILVEKYGNRLADNHK